jgi:hypothetical protein
LPAAAANTLRHDFERNYRPRRLLQTSPRSLQRYANSFHSFWRRWGTLAPAVETANAAAHGGEPTAAAVDELINVVARFAGDELEGPFPERNIR